MNKPSIINFDKLISPVKLKELCKAISVLEAIICPEWELRYYSYQQNWDKNEELCEVRNSEGDAVLILFQQNGICINCFDKTCIINSLSNDVQEISFGIKHELPEQFSEFIFGEPVKSIGTTFCIWSVNGRNWKVWNKKLFDDEDKSAVKNLLELFDGNPMTYKKWAEEYYECELNIKYIEEVYKGSILSKEIVIGINPNFDDYEQLKADLAEIGYSYNF